MKRSWRCAEASFDLMWTTLGKKNFGEQGSEQAFCPKTARAQRRQELLRYVVTTGLPVNVPVTLADIHEPPVPLDELERYWMEDANDDPRRFIVSGSSETDFSRAIFSFLKQIRDMETSDCPWQKPLSLPLASSLASHFCLSS